MLDDALDQAFADLPLRLPDLVEVVDHQLYAQIFVCCFYKLHILLLLICLLGGLSLYGVLAGERLVWLSILFGDNVRPKLFLLFNSDDGEQFSQVFGIVVAEVLEVDSDSLDKLRLEDYLDYFPFASERVLGQQFLGHFGHREQRAHHFQSIFQEITTNLLFLLAFFIYDLSVDFISLRQSIHQSLAVDYLKDDLQSDQVEHLPQRLAGAHVVQNIQQPLVRLVQVAQIGKLRQLYALRQALPLATTKLVQLFDKMQVELVVHDDLLDLVQGETAKYSHIALLRQVGHGLQNLQAHRSIQQLQLPYDLLVEHVPEILLVEVQDLLSERQLHALLNQEEAVLLDHLLLVGDLLAPIEDKLALDFELQWLFDWLVHLQTKLIQVNYTESKYKLSIN